jgi:rfaE bifunctional protein nucleotidyltransferase chain/domain
LREKIKNLGNAKKIREEARAEGKVVVFTNGCFDLVHAGHVDYLEAARAEGDMLIVGMNSDASMKRIKGKKRPLTPAAQRAAVLAGLYAVDLVVEFDEDDPLNIIKALKPDVLVKGADWAEDRIIGAAAVKEAGGRVVRVELTEGPSTSEMIEKIVDKYGDKTG